MGALFVPDLDERPWPTLGAEVCDFIEERVVYGPGSLQGLPYEIDPEFRAFIYRAYEIYPQGHPWAGRRRFKRVGMSVRKGLAKTERQAIIAYCEVHPEGPTRFDGWDSHGQPVGRPVRAPYIPMLAVTAEQVEELAFGALRYMCAEGPDSMLFDIQKDQVNRLDARGREDGKAAALAGSPGARDGARTTLNCFDEPHRLYLPRQKAAHTAMDANLPKRPLDDPWSLYVGTAGELGQGSVAEELHEEALAIKDGLIERPDLFYLYRTDDNPKRDLTDKAERIKAVAEATGPAGEWGPGQFDEIASKWDRPGADKPYLERVWLNRWVKSGAQAFDLHRWGELATTSLIPDGATVVAGFDGARFRDATGIVLTEVETGRQMLWAGWEKPLDWPTGDDAPPWEINEADVTHAVEEMHERFTVHRALADPAHWTETIGSYAGRWGVWEEYWTMGSPKKMAWALRWYRDAMATGAVTHEEGRPGREDLEFSFDRHIGNAGRTPVNVFDDAGERMFVLSKIHPDRKFDYAMAGVISWVARLDAIRSGVRNPSGPVVPQRIR